MTHHSSALPFMFRREFAVALGLVLVAPSCTNTAKESAAKAGAHAQYLAEMTSQDVEEVRNGLPQGAQVLSKAFEGSDLVNDPALAREALESARGRVQDLRVAKSSFFALVKPDGEIVRNDRDPDLMASKNLFASLPSLKGALGGKYVEATGSMHEARGVEGRPDGQWMAAQGVLGPTGDLAVYVTGWAWSVYATRLEHGLRGRILDTEKEGKEPLSYVFIVVGDRAYGSPASPEVNAEAIQKLEPNSLVSGDQVVTRELEITGRAFGLGLVPAPALGDGVLVAVLRSET